MPSTFIINHILLNLETIDVNYYFYKFLFFSDNTNKILKHDLYWHLKQIKQSIIPSHYTQSQYWQRIGPARSSLRRSSTVTFTHATKRKENCIARRKRSRTRDLVGNIVSFMVTGVAERVIVIQATFLWSGYNLRLNCELFTSSLRTNCEI